MTQSNALISTQRRRTTGWMDTRMTGNSLIALHWSCCCEWQNACLRPLPETRVQDLRPQTWKAQCVTPTSSLRLKSGSLTSCCAFSAFRRVITTRRTTRKTFVRVENMLGVRRACRREHQGDSVPKPVALVPLPTDCHQWRHRSPTRVQGPGRYFQRTL